MITYGDNIPPDGKQRQLGGGRTTKLTSGSLYSHPSTVTNVMVPESRTYHSMKEYCHFTPTPDPPNQLVWYPLIEPSYPDAFSSLLTTSNPYFGPLIKHYSQGESSARIVHVTRNPGIFITVQDLQDSITPTNMIYQELLILGLEVLCSQFSGS